MGVSGEAEGPERGRGTEGPERGRGGKRVGVEGPRPGRSARYIILISGERLCPDCKGRGRQWVKIPGGRPVELSCGTCHGSGKLKPVRSSEVRRV